MSLHKNYKYLLSCVICLLLFSSFSQSTSGELSRTIDSLKRALKNAKHDTTRCAILDAIIENENDDAIWPSYNKELRTLSEKNLNSNPANKNIYLRYLSKAIYYEGYLAEVKGYNERAIDLYTESIAVKKQLNDTLSMSFTLNNIGLIYKKIGNLHKAAQVFQEALMLQQASKDEKGVSITLNNIGLLNYYQGNIPLALENYFLSLKKLEKLNDFESMATAISNIAMIYHKQGDITKALEFNEKSLALREKLMNKSGIAVSLNNIAAIYQDQGNIGKALDYFLRSLAIRREINDKAGEAQCLLFIGSIYKTKGNITKALDYANQSLKIREEKKDKVEIGASLNYIAGLLMSQGDLMEALKNGKRSLDFALELGFPLSIMNSASTLKDIYKKQNKYKEAFQMFELEISMRDSINNQETQKATIKKQLQYTYEKKELETKANQDKKNAVAKAELKQKENERNYFIAGFGLVLMLALFILRGYKQKQKANAIILQQKYLVDEKQKEILDSIHYAKKIQLALLPSEKYIYKGLKQLKTKTLLSFAICLLSPYSFSQNTDSLKLALKNVKHDTARVKLLNTLSEYFSPGEDQWYIYNEEIIKICEKYAHRLATRTDTFFIRNLASSISNKGYVINTKGNALEGLAYFERSLKLHQRTNDEQNVAATLINIGSVYDSQGNLPKSLNYYHHGLTVMEKLKDKEGMAVTFINIGNIYKKLKDLTTATNYYTKSLALYTDLKNENGIGLTLNYIGMIYDDQLNLKTALEYYKKSLSLGEKLHNKNISAKALNNIGNVYRQLNDFKNAKEYFIKSLNDYEALKDLRGLANTNDNLAKVYLSEGNLPDAYKMAKKGFDMAQTTGNIRAIRFSSRTLKLVFQKQNKYKDAFEMFALEVKMGDSINNQETQKAALKKRLQYDYERKEIELKAEQDKKDAITKASLEQKEKERNYFIVGFGLVLILAIFILRSFRQKQKDNIIIKAQKELVDAKQKEILDSIYYAKRIQTALLPSEKYIDKSMKQLNNKTLLSLIFCLLSFCSFSQSMDSLKLALKNAKHDTTRCNILSILAETAGDDEWPKYNDQLRQLAEKNSSENTLLKKFYLKHLANALNDIGYLANLKGNIPEALAFYHKSLKIQEEILDKEGIANSLINIGYVYHGQGDLQKALEFWNKGLKSCEENRDKKGMAISLNNIGNIYKDQNESAKALSYYLMSLKIKEEIGDKRGVANSLINIGAIYRDQSDFAHALECYQRSLEISQEIENKSGVSSSLVAIGSIYKSKGYLKEGFVYAKRGMQLAEELGYPENIKNAAQLLKSIFQKQNKFKEAFEMYELEIKMRDSINNQQTQKAAIKKQLQYTYEKKQLQTKAEQDKKDTIAKAALKQKENERNYFIVGFILVGILALFILRGYKQKQKANAIILQQKRLVDEKQKEILDSIHYAKRIQLALLPSEKYIDKSLNQLNKKVFSCILCLMSFLSFSQNVDSLKLLLKNAKHDTTRCNILSKLSELAAEEECPVFNAQLELIARDHLKRSAADRNFYLKQLGISLVNNGYFSHQTGNYKKAISDFEKGLEIQKNLRDTAGIILSLTNIGVLYQDIGDPFKSLQAFNDQLKYNTAIKDRKGIANSLFNIGSAYYDEGLPAKAIEFYNKSLKIEEEIDNKIGIAFCLNDIALVYQNQGDIPKALEYHFRCLKIRENLNAKTEIAYSLNNIGLIYKEQLETNKALTYYNKCLKIMTEIGDQAGVGLASNNIGLVFVDRKEFDIALSYFTKSLSIYQKLENPKGIANALKNIGLVLKYLGKYDEAIENYYKSLKIQREIFDEKGKTRTLIELANLKLKQDLPDQAFGFASEAIIASKKLGFPLEIRNSANVLKTIFQKQNKYKDAFEMYELEIKMRDSINNQETQKATVKKQMQYEYEKKALETKAEQDKKDAIAKAELIQKENERNYFIAGFGLVLVLALFILRGYRQKQKANAIILQQKNLVDEKQKEILDSVHYAKRIQTALLPNEKYINKNLKHLNKS